MEKRYILESCLQVTTVTKVVREVHHMGPEGQPMPVDYVGLPYSTVAPTTSPHPHTMAGQYRPTYQDYDRYPVYPTYNDRPPTPPSPSEPSDSPTPQHGQCHPGYIISNSNSSILHHSSSHFLIGCKSENHCNPYIVTISH